MFHFANEDSKTKHENNFAWVYGYVNGLVSALCEFLAHLSQRLRVGAFSMGRLHRPFTVSNDLFSETIGPIVTTKFHNEGLVQD